MATGLHLELDDEELAQLLPMVQDLLGVAQNLRHEASIGIDRAGPRDLLADQPA
jgi:hypothetical protein